MSRTTMFAFPASGPCAACAEFINAWGSCMRIWRPLAQKYLGDPIRFMMSEMERKRLWALSDDQRLDPAERVTLLTTFDCALVRRDRFREVAAALRAFDRLHPTEGVNHLPAMAEALERLEGAEAAGWQQTSVSESPWWVREEGRPYDLARDCGHFFVGE